MTGRVIFMLEEPSMKILLDGFLPRLVPDTWQKPSVELTRLIPTFQKGSGARAMSVRLRETPNHSKSFQVFVKGVRRIATEISCE